MKKSIFYILFGLIFLCGCSGKNLPDGCEWCKRCQGIGYLDPCKKCDATGIIKCIYCQGIGRWGSCKYCNGTGYTLEYNEISGKKEKEICSKCNGTGKGECNPCNGKGYKTCNVCSGRRYINICPECNGKGYVPIGHYYSSLEK